MRRTRAVQIGGALALLGAGVLAIPWWRRHVSDATMSPDHDPPAPQAAPTYRVVPLHGDIAAMAAPDACVPVVAEITTHPHWQFQLGTAWHSCLNIGLSDVYTVSDSADVAWDSRALPLRHLTLTDDERGILQRFAHLSCKAPADDDRPGWCDAYLAALDGLASGRMNADDEAARIPGRSEMALALDQVFTAARARYVAQRLAQLGEVKLELAAKPVDDQPWSPKTAVYAVALIGRTLEIRRGDRLVARAIVADADVIDLADWALSRPPDAPDDTDGARGRVFAGGRWRPIVLGPFARDPLMAITTPMLNAIYDDSVNRAR